LTTGRDSDVFVPGCGGFGLLAGLDFFGLGVALNLAAGGGVWFLTGGVTLDLAADGCCGFFEAAGPFLVGEVRARRADEAPR
jgi:hypothetical protein